MTRNSQQANIAMSVMNPGMNLAMNGLTLGIYWIGAALISAIAVTSPAAMMERIGLFSDMVVFMQYAMQVIMAFLMLVMIFVMLPRVTVSASRVNEVLDTKARIVDGKETQGKPGMKAKSSSATSPSAIPMPTATPSTTSPSPRITARQLPSSARRAAARAASST